MSEVEYRVRWQRAGLGKRIKIYQTLAAAQGFVETLTGKWLAGWDENSPQYEIYADVPALLSEPVIESRPVGPWRVA